MATPKGTRDKIGQWIYSDSGYNPQDSHFWFCSEVEQWHRPSRYQKYKDKDYNKKKKPNGVQVDKPKKSNLRNVPKGKTKERVLQSEL